MASLDITSSIGNTPVIELPLVRSRWKLFLKMEKFNPGQSMKDRMALSMVANAEAEGRLKPGGTLIESSSGNTATSLAMIGASRGYNFIAVVDSHASRQKLDTIQSYGGRIIEVGLDKAKGQVAIQEREEMARALARETAGSIWTNQADNSSNAEGYRTLAREIVNQVGVPDVLVGAIGTGGSLCGTARELRKFNSLLSVVAVEPVGSTIFGGAGGTYYQSGSGNPPGAPLPRNIDFSIIDQADQVSDEDAFGTARLVARKAGVLVGGSAGGVLFKALDLTCAKGAGTIVAIMADGGEKYATTIFNDEWMAARQLLNFSAQDRLCMIMGAK